jgi:nucleolin
VLRSKTQSAFTPSVFRRFNSDEASAEKQNSSVESADGEHGAVKSAIESASTYASEKASEFADTAAETVNETYGQAREAIGNAAEAVGAATGANSGYTPRERRPERQGYGGERRASGGRDYNNGGDRRGGYGGDRAERRFAPVERKLTPTPGVYVGNLLFDVTAADLEREFATFGPIKNAVIASDARGLSKGYVPPYLRIFLQLFRLQFD